MQRNIDESTRPLLLSSVMEEKAFGVTLAEGRGLGEGAGPRPTRACVCV